MSKPKRKYTKKSSYWDNLSKRTKVDLGSDSDSIEPVMCGDNYYVSNSSVKGVKNIPQGTSVASSVSDALRAGGTSSTGTRFNRAGSGSKKEKYKNIEVPQCQCQRKYISDIYSQILNKNYIKK